MCARWGRSCGLSFGGWFCWFVLGSGRSFCGSVLVEETVSFWRGRICVSDSREGAFWSLFLGGRGLVLLLWGVCTCLLWGWRRVFASSLLERSLSVCLRGRSGRRGLPVPDSHCLLSPGQRFHLRTGLSLGPRPPAASRSGFRRPPDGRPWRRLRALRLPRLPGWLRLRRHPRVLNVPAQLWRSQRPLAPDPKDLTLCLRRPLPRNWTSLHLSIMVTPPPPPPQSGKSWNLAYGMVTALSPG